MPSSRLRLRERAALGAALLLAACSGGEPTAPGVTVTLSSRSVTLQLGDSATLTAAVTGSGGAVGWSSADPGVVTVREGTLHAVGPGDASVVARVGSAADTARVSVTAPPAPEQEARALWVNRFEYNSPEKVAEIVRKAAEARFNLIYFQVRGQGDAYYASELEPCAISLCGSLGNGQPAWDPLEVAVREAHARGLELHAWINAFTAWASPKSNNETYCGYLKESAPGSPRHMLLEHPEWAMVRSDGSVMSCANSQAVEYAYVSPGIPAVREHLARVAADLARRYAVDGIHLDRVRYPGTAWSHDTTSLRLFGRDPADHPAEWTRFRQDQVGLAVRAVHDSIRAVRPEVVLSAAVWGIFDDLWGWSSSRGAAQYLQDPRAWAAGGYLDVAVPMTYYNIHPTYCGFADWLCLLDDHLGGLQRPTGRSVYIGIGANIPAGKGNQEVVRQIAWARVRGARGVALYSYNSVESQGLWSVLASGPFATAAVVPDGGG